MRQNQSLKTNKISVIIPNYNYAQYISPRLQSIFSQEYPLHEVIVIDDASDDDSIERIKLESVNCPTKFTLLQREANSGKAFSQWLCAIRECTGDLIWIAEADDLCAPSFAAALVPFFEDENVNLAFCDSAVIDENGKILQVSYKSYYKAIGADALTQTLVVNGVDFLLDFLTIRNTIMNVSSVIWRRDIIIEVLQCLQEELQQFRLAGDWRIYVEICLLGGKIAYDSNAFNMHRRHKKSVTSNVTSSRHVEEVRLVHQAISKRLGGVFQVEMAQYRAWLAAHLQNGSGILER